jgi:hypothetical protein
MLRKLPVLLLVILAGGCVGGWCVQRSHVSEYRSGESPEVKPAPCEGTYALYGVANDPQAASTEQAPSADLLRAQSWVLGGHALGFEKDEEGRLWAVADEKKIPLPEGLFWWELVPGLGPAGSLGNRIGTTVDQMLGPVEIVLGPVGIVLRFVGPLLGRL